MFTKRIIPCLDVNNGRVVKGVNFVNLRDAGDPVEIAAAYDKENNLVGVTSKPVTVAAEYDTIDSVVLEKVTGADRISVMVWDGFSNMKPYCMAKLAQ